MTTRNSNLLPAHLRPDGIADGPLVPDPLSPPTVIPPPLETDDETPANASPSDPIESALPAVVVPIDLDDDGDETVDAGTAALISTGLPVILGVEPLMAAERTLQTSTAAATMAEHGVPAHEGIVCPFCAHVRPGESASAACPRCTMQDTPSTRRSTGERIGPWFVLQRKNPTAPGLRFSVLLTLARRGHVTARSIVRGPTTGQLWRYAAQVKGLSRLFGVCWHCGVGVSPDAMACPRCSSAQEIPDDPDTFLESYASLPVMREVSPPSLANETASAALPAPASGPAEDSLRALTFGSSAITNQEARPAPRAERRSIIPPTPPASTLPARRPTTRGSQALAIPNGNEAGQAIMSASELAAVFQLDAPARPGVVRRTSRFALRATKTILILAIVAGIAGTAVAYLKPEWAAQGRAVVEPPARRAWASAAEWIAHRNNGATPPSGVPSTPASADALPPITPIELVTGGPPNAGAADDRGGGATPRQPTVITPATRPANARTPSGTQLDALGGQASNFGPATRPTIIGTPPPATRPATIIGATPSTPQRQAPPAPAPTPPREPARHEQTLDESIAEATALRNSGLDAEARRDWRAAVLIYEQISKLPEAAWPSDLKVRLSVARERLGN